MIFSSPLILTYQSKDEVLLRGGFKATLQLQLAEKLNEKGNIVEMLCSTDWFPNWFFNQF